MAPEHRTPLRRISHGSLSNLARSASQLPSHTNDPTRLNFLMPAFSDLADEMASLHANLENLNHLSYVLETFNESFASYLYALRMNAFCVEWEQAPGDTSFIMAAKAAEEAQAALARLTAQQPPETTRVDLNQDAKSDITYATEEPSTATVKAPAKAAPQGILKNAGASSKLPVKGSKMSAKDKKARDAKIDRVIQLLPLEFRGNDPEIRRVMEGVIGSLMDHEAGQRIAEIVKPPLLPQARVNKCLIALVNRKIVEKEANKGIYATRTVGSLLKNASSSGYRSSATALSPSPTYPRRRYSSQSFDPNAPKRGITNFALFGTMMIIGVCGIGYGVYEMYAIMGMWPQEVRNDLRVAIRAKHKEDYQTSATYFKRAYFTAVSLPDPVKSFGDDHVLKISSIALALADVLEATNLGAAYSVYQTALADVRLSERELPTDSQPLSKLNAERRTRAIGISLKLGEIGEQLLDTSKKTGKPNEYGPNDKNEVEDHLNWALEESLRAIQAQRTETSKSAKDAKLNESGEAKREEGELVLPRWVDGVDVGAVVERVADYYSRKGKREYAVPLFLHAISTLLSPPAPSGVGALLGTKPEPSPEDKCKAATLMNNLSALFAEQKPINIPQAKAWAQKGYEIVQKARSGAKSTARTECDVALAVIVFNLGMLSEMSKEKTDAERYFKQALELSETVGLSDGVSQSRQALQRLGQTR